MKLLNAEIHKYKSIETKQSFSIEDGITVLVGMNEAGKTSVLEAIAKVNYFTSDDEFKFDTTHDYPRKEKKKLDKSGEDPVAVALTFEIDDTLLKAISNDIGNGVFDVKKFTYSKKYGNGGLYSGIRADKTKFLDIQAKALGIDAALLTKLKQCNDKAGFNVIVKAIEDEEVKEQIETLSIYFENKWNWESDPLGEYVARTHIGPNIPKFLYYDEYYLLPSEVLIEDLVADKGNKDSGEYKTAKALFELADINIDDLINSDDFEDYIAELEATQALISKELFKYWSTNKNLKIRFAIDKKVEKVTNYNNNREDRIIHHFLNIRVENTRSDMTLPLKNRSKGFNWFFSFLVWFKKIQEDANTNYILLLDEPGLNLHASAQEDLLRFFEDLSKEYQIIYTTHSPFMIDSAKLPSVRTVVETEEGTKVSDTIQEKDPKTLFPLQAALGYNIAQNLFISKNNLLVEGVSDLIYLTIISDLLKANKRIGLKDDVTIVPVGGLDKVTTFISLLGANKLNLVCLLDSFLDQKGKTRLDDLIKGNIVKQKNVKFFDQYVTLERADLEDLFEKSEYVELFNEAFKGEYNIDISTTDSSIPNILGQINKAINKTHFNHYRPAKLLASKGVDIKYFSSATLTRFEEVFKDINKLFKD
jgi:predicted ATP-dependent endonuclease of OLD family